MTIYKVSTWPGLARQRKGEMLDLRHFSTKEGAKVYLNQQRAAYRRKSDTHHITTGGPDYFTFKYDWPIKNVELRHTYAIIPVHVEE